jgi:hypothetical protein
MERVPKKSKVEKAKELQVKDPTTRDFQETKEKEEKISIVLDTNNLPTLEEEEEKEDRVDLKSKHDLSNNVRYTPSTTIVVQRQPLIQSETQSFSLPAMTMTIQSTTTISSNATSVPPNTNPTANHHVNKAIHSNTTSSTQRHGQPLTLVHSGWEEKSSSASSPPSGPTFSSSSSSSSSSSPPPAVAMPLSAEEKKEELRRRVRSKKHIHNLFWFFLYLHLLLNFAFFTFAIIVLCDETSNDFSDSCRNIRERVFIPLGVVLFVVYFGGRMKAIRKLSKAYQMKRENSLPQFLWRPHLLVASFIPEVVSIACAGYLYYVSSPQCHEFYKDNFPGMIYFSFYYFYLTGGSWLCFMFVSLWNMKWINPLYRFWTVQKSFTINPEHLMVRLDQISQCFKPAEVLEVP